MALKAQNDYIFYNFWGDMAPLPPSGYAYVYQLTESSERLRANVMKDYKNLACFLVDYAKLVFLDKTQTMKQRSDKNDDEKGFGGSRSSSGNPSLPL